MLGICFVGFGQVLVKILYSGICGSQLNEIDATKGPDRFFEIVKKMGEERKIFVLLAGYRRQYIIKLLEK